MTGGSALGAVVIGRNEGQRLVKCLVSLKQEIDLIVYVDSGSTDGSPRLAQDIGAKVVELDLSAPFSAARARNAGFEALQALSDTRFVQFIDGDCELRKGWLRAAVEFMNANPRAAVACGRLRERYPEASIFNQLCDFEWDTPVGKSTSCGGIAMYRTAAFRDVGGFNPTLIAGEEPELCLRLRQKGWEIWRLDHEMAWHDAAMTRFGQWWKRARRGGYAFAQGAAMHGAPPERHWVKETRRAVFWGGALPVALLVSAVIVSPYWLLGLLLYPAQVLRLYFRDPGAPGSFARALFLVLGKFPEASGVLSFRIAGLRGKERAIMEYK